MTNIFFYTFTVLVSKRSNEEGNQKQLRTDFLFGRHLASNKEKSSLIYIILYLLTIRGNVVELVFTRSIQSHWSSLFVGWGVKNLDTDDCKVFCSNSVGWTRRFIHSHHYHGDVLKNTGKKIRLPRTTVKPRIFFTPTQKLLIFRCLGWILITEHSIFFLFCYNYEIPGWSSLPTTHKFHRNKRAGRFYLAPPTCRLLQRRIDVILSTSQIKLLSNRHSLK